MVYTGRMKAPHYAGFITSDVLETTPMFFDLSCFVSYKILSESKWNIQLKLGFENILNQYQKDFDQGAYRDAGYVYGPMSPFMTSFGIKITTL